MIPYSETIVDTHNLLVSHESKELVRFLTCGSVDDGKSTLIGRLLYDTKMIEKDMLETLIRDSVTQGSVGGSLDPALLMDGLKAEREQGITIDVAYRHFSTLKRKFIIADTPGHEQYTRNMATGASTADLAVILVDARNGVLEQTKRHGFIVSLLGIKHVFVAINKMDLVDFSHDVYDTIKKEFSAFAARLDFNDLHFIPISALHGDNVAYPSEHTPWYQGGTLLHLLDTVHIAADRNYVDFRFPVQYVNRPNAEFRGYSGTIVSGVVRPGDEVMVFPSKKTTKVKAIETYDGELQEAFIPQAVTLLLDDDLDVSRGDMIVHVNNAGSFEDSFEAMVVWMGEEKLVPGKQYAVKHATKTVQGRVEEVRYEIDVNTLRRREAETLRQNMIGRCAFNLDEPIVFDSYKQNRATGGFIIIDRFTNDTVGAGIILDRHKGSSGDREQTSQRQYPVFWLTGNTGSGKSTLASHAERFFNLDLPLSHHSARRVVVLDGDEMRESISTEEDLSPEGRREHNLRVARLAHLLSKKGFLVIVSVIAPFKNVRREIDGICNPVWVYVKRSGLDADDRPYEPPSSPDFIVNNDKLDEADARQVFINFLRERTDA